MYIFPHKPKKKKMSMSPQLLHQHLLPRRGESTTLPNLPFSGAPSFLQGLSVVDQEKIDNLMLEMDGTENKCNFFICFGLGIKEHRRAEGGLEWARPRLAWQRDLWGRREALEKLNS